jgi:hypothetical protein
VRDQVTLEDRRWLSRKIEQTDDGNGSPEGTEYHSPHSSHGERKVDWEEMVRDQEARSTESQGA